MRHRSLARLFSFCTFAALVQGACAGSDEEKLTAARLAEDCSLNSQCAAELACIFGRCHDKCETDEDCERKERCVKTPAGKGVCQLPDETQCKEDQECKESQVCGVDGECRDPCSQASECIPGQICAQSGECASTDPSKDTVDTQGNILSSGGSSGAGSEGGASTGGAGGAGHTGGTAAGGAAGGVTSGGAGGESEGGAATGGSGVGGDGAGGATGGAEGGAGGSPFDYTETSDGVEVIDNNDRDHVVPAGSSASIYLPPDADEDWFSLQAPDDGKAHLISIHVTQTPELRTEVHAVAAADFSEIAPREILQPGVTSDVYVTVGPGSLTLIRLLGYSTYTGRANLTFEMTPELDDNEPNQDCDTASPIALNTDVSAQLVIPYTSMTDRAPDDWYKVDLAAVPTTLNLLSVPTNGRIAISRVPDSGVSTTIVTTAAGQSGPFTFTPTAAGTFCLHFAAYSTTITAFTSGAKPSNMSDPYVFRVEQ